MADGYKTTFSGNDEDLINQLNDLPISELKTLYKNKNGNTKSNKSTTDIISKVYKHRRRSKNPESSSYTPWNDIPKKAPVSASPFANIPSPATKKAAGAPPVGSNAGRSVYDASYFIDNGFYPEDASVSANKEIANMNASSFIDNAVPGTKYFNENKTSPIGTSAANSGFSANEKDLLDIYMNKAPDQLGRTGQRYVHSPAEMPYDINEGMIDPMGPPRAPAAPVDTRAPMGPPRASQSAFNGGGPSVAYMQAPTKQNYATVDPFNLFGNRNGVNPFAANGAPITNNRFNGGRAPD